MSPIRMCESRSMQSSSSETCTLSLHTSEVTGLGYSRTTMSKQHVLVLPAPSVARKHRFVVPISKFEPLGVAGHRCRER